MRLSAREKLIQKLGEHRKSLKTYESLKATARQLESLTWFYRGRDYSVHVEDMPDFVYSVVDECKLVVGTNAPDVFEVTLVADTGYRKPRYVSTAFATKEDFFLALDPALHHYFDDYDLRLEAIGRVEKACRIAKHLNCSDDEMMLMFPVIQSLIDRKPTRTRAVSATRQAAITGAMNIEPLLHTLAEMALKTTKDE